MRFDQNDCRTPRERVDGEMAARMIKESGCGGLQGCLSGCSEKQPLARGENGRPACPQPSPTPDCSCRRSAGRQGGTRGCGARGVWGLEGYPLAMVYAPSQRFSDIDCPEKGLAAGTIFRELALPFVGKGSRGGM